MKFEESPLVELKREVNTDFKKEIVAFANTDGGEIFVGVEDDGTVTGVTDSDKVITQISNIIRDAIKPDLTIYTSIESILVEEKRVIHVTVLRGTKRPYHFSDKGLKPSGVFIRHGRSSVPATDDTIRQLLRESDGAEFDRSRSTNQDLTFTYAESFFRANEVHFADNNRRTLGLVDIDGYYTNTGLLLSDQCAHSIKCAVFEGNGKTKFKSRVEFNGSILKQMDGAFEFLRMCNNLNSSFDGLKRIDHPDYPEYALRETLLNAIIHRDYDYSGSIIINVFDNRIEFVSLGGLVKGITMEDIMGGVSQPRNMVVANVFFRLELIEAYGTGIQRIMESYDHCMQKPVFHSAPASFIVTLPKNDPTMPSLDVNDITREELVLQRIKDQGVITRKDVELMLGKSKYTAITVLNHLLSSGKIRRTGSARASEYRLLMT